MNIQKDELRPIEILTDIVGLFGLMYCWIFLWVPFPVFFMKVAQSEHPLIVFAILIAICITFSIIAFWVSKAVIIRSRKGLVFAGFVLIGFAIYLGFLFVADGLPMPQKAAAGSALLTVSILGITCLCRATQRKGMEKSNET